MVVGSSKLTVRMSAAYSAARGSVKRIVVADTHVPFVEGGAELHIRALVDQLTRRGHEVVTVAVPFRPQPKAELLAAAATWRVLDFSAFNGRETDVLIATRFPSYFARHPHKVAWIIHQHRAAYELCGTPYSDFEHTEADVGLRRRLFELDARMLGECRRVFANAGNTAGRLRKYNGIDADALYHPPPLADRLRPGDFTDYILVVGRLESIKRPELAIRGLAHTAPHLRLVVVGEGPYRPTAESIAVQAGCADRVVFAGKTGVDELVRLYSRALAVCYAPFDEDYGYVTLEAFLSGKPVITATDSGGTLEFVTDGVTGFVCEPEPSALGAAMQRLAGDKALAATLGDAGYHRARTITWEGVIDRLLGPPPGS
jgi:glycosyltransferase involved in cell wall biosynthesis